MLLLLTVDLRFTLSAILGSFRVFSGLSECAYFFGDFRNFSELFGSHRIFSYMIVLISFLLKFNGRNLFSNVIRILLKQKFRQVHYIHHFLILSNHFIKDRKEFYILYINKLHHQYWNII